jgi:hypothetical protein
MQNNIKQKIRLSILLLPILIMGFNYNSINNNDALVNKTILTSTAFGETISYKSDIQPIWNKYCVECHDVTGGETPLLIPGKSYENVVPAYITTYNLSQSRIYVQVNSGNMPDGKPRIPQNEIDKILRWLKQGYQNN